MFIISQSFCKKKEKEKRRKKKIVLNYYLHLSTSKRHSHSQSQSQVAVCNQTTKNGRTKEARTSTENAQIHGVSCHIDLFRSRLQSLPRQSHSPLGNLTLNLFVSLPKIAIFFFPRT